MASVGLCVPQLGPAVDTALLRDFAQQAEEMGFDALYVQDHFLYALAQEGGYGGSAAEQPERYKSVWAPLQLLAALAAWTSRIELGTSILVAGNHWPAPLAQQLATIDQLSGGRFRTLGLSVGWSREEHRSVGVDPATRGRRMDEFVPALVACWGDDPVEFSGSLVEVPRSIMRPKPVRLPRLMSGMWSEAGLTRTARDFDLWNPGSMPVEQVTAMLSKINGQRDPAMAPVDVLYRVALESTSGTRLSVDEVAARTVEVVDAGYEGVIVETNFVREITTAAQWLDQLRALAPVLHAARG